MTFNPFTYMKRKQQIALLAKELAKIDADYRSNLNLSRDATEEEIDKNFSNKTRFYNQRATALLDKLLGVEEPEKAPEGGK